MWEGEKVRFFLRLLIIINEFMNYIYSSSKKGAESTAEKYLSAPEFWD